MDKWDDAYLAMADRFAQLSSAKRAQVGAVIVKDDRIISIGYNGMPSGWTNECEEAEYVRSDDQIPSPYEMKRMGFTDTESGWWRYRTKREVLHAEANAIAKVARSTESSEGSTIYTTMLPCLDCAKLIYQSGITRVVYRDSYPKGTLGLEFLKKCNITVQEHVH